MRLLALNDNRITRDGVIVIKAQSYRTQESNRTEALARLHELIERASLFRRPRRATRPTLASRMRRLDKKARHGQIKAGRRPVTD